MEIGSRICEVRENNFRQEAVTRSHSLLSFRMALAMRNLLLAGYYRDRRYHRDRSHYRDPRRTVIVGATVEERRFSAASTAKLTRGFSP